VPKLKSLFTPGYIGNMQLKNRIIMSPMATLSHDREGGITEKAVNYYAERARGGVGFIICQSGVIMRESRAPRRASVYDDKFIPGLRRIAEAIHQYDCKAAFQLVHHGRLLAGYLNMLEKPEEIKVVAPSPVPRLLNTVEFASRGGQAGTMWVQDNSPPPEATKEDIKRIVQGFADAAWRVKEAGFDAVEIHGGHGYLISQFLSPLVNRRTDEYGGSPEKRARFACEVIEAVRKKVGPDFPVLFRFSGSDFMPGGISIDDSKKQAPMFVEAGADALDISASEQASVDWQYPSFLFPQGPLVFLAEEIKKVVNVPVIAVGKINDPLFADEILNAGKADFVALGRALLADPQWPNKAREGRFDDIRPCIYCVNCLNFGAHPEILKDGLHCSVNPELMKEKDFAVKPAASQKKVIVIGGGPAGMEAARVLAERGHRTILYEKRDKLGGQWYIASQQPQKKADYSKLLDYLIKGIKKAGVDIRLNTEVTVELVEDEKPDAIVMATGAVPAVLNVRGVDNKNVVQAVDIIEDKVTIGRNVLVIGGRYLGMEIADQLADEGKKVSLATRRSLGRGMEKNIYLTLRNRLIQKGVHLYPYCPVVEIMENGAYVVFEGELVFIGADTIIQAVGFLPENRLASRLKDLARGFYQVGDCLEPRDVMSAIREGANAGRAI